MHLVEKHIITKESKFYKEVDHLCFMSKNLYNVANYSVRQEFISTSIEKEQGLRDYANYKNYHTIRKELQGQVDYIALPQKVANHTLRLLDKAWVSFFKSIKDWKKNPSKYLGKPCLPRYLDTKIGRQVVSYEKGAISIKELKKGFVKLSGTKISIPFINRDKELVSARIVPTKNNEYKIEIIYKGIEQKLKTEGIVAGIDLGINNLMSIAFGEKNVQPIIISGKPVKSINQYYNKNRAELQEKLKKAQPKKLVEKKEKDSEKKIIKEEREGLSTSNAIKRLTAKRNHKIDDYMHKATTLVIRECLKKNVKLLVIGKNIGWKQECNIGKKNNQNFVGIPFNKAIDMLKYKGRLVGIEVITEEESYTSKCSFLELEKMCHHEKYLGRRTSRGCFITSEGKRINADINGAYNIIRKVAPEIFSKGVEGFAVNPVNLFIHK